MMTTRVTVQFRGLVVDMVGLVGVTLMAVPPRYSLPALPILPPSLFGRAGACIGVHDGQQFVSSRVDGYRTFLHLQDLGVWRFPLKCRNPLNPSPTPAPIPSAVDPHTVERAWFRASRWSAPLYERPGRPGPRLLGSAWVDGGRDGSHPQTRPYGPAGGHGAPSIPVPADPPPEASSVTVGRVVRYSPHGRRPNPPVGARRRSAGGAGRRQERRPERSREARPAERSAAGA